MYTPGPAISFLICFWCLPQNEHDKRSFMQYPYHDSNTDLRCAPS
jgi:hypothetical protein